jgi:hypothetical protein
MTKNSDRAASYYEWIKAIVRSRDRSITRAAGTGIALATYGDFGHGAWPSMGLLAEDVDLSERQVRHHLFLLIVGGWLHQYKRWGGTDVYCIRNDADGVEHNCRWARNLTADYQDSLSREDLQQGSPPSADGGRLAGTERPVGDEIDVLVATITGDGDLTAAEGQAITAAIRSALAAGVAARQAQRAVEQLLLKRKMGLIRVSPLNEAVVAAFISRVRTERRGPSGRSLKERKDEAIRWEVEHASDLWWYRKLEPATGDDLRELLDAWDVKQAREGGS